MHNVYTNILFLILNGIVRLNISFCVTDNSFKEKPRELITVRQY